MIFLITSHLIELLAIAYMTTPHQRNTIKTVEATLVYMCIHTQTECVHSIKCVCVCICRKYILLALIPFPVENSLPI